MDQTVNQRFMSSESGRRPVCVFFVLVFLLAMPFYLLAALFGKAWAKVVPINLPLSAGMFMTPLLAAAILTHQEQGPAGVRRLLRTAFDYRRIKNKRWYLVILGLWPAVMLLDYGLMTLRRKPLPDLELPLWMVPIFLVVFFVAGIGEELGWTAYATDRLQDHSPALQASIGIGAVWALLHVPADVQAHHGFTWILWQRLGTVVLRILTVWLYNNTGKSVFATVLFHAMVNVSVFTFPNLGSHYDPFLTLLISVIMAALAIVLWGPDTLAHYRNGRSLSLRRG
jgi:membrane protease YdiL (CAAX protease family)